MNLPRYNVLASIDRLRYEFVSVGPRGAITKVVEYTYLPAFGMWNLGFGDYDSSSNSISDSVVSNNGDGRKVLATVAMTLVDFFTEYPGETIIFTGSNELRTMVYQRAILHYYASFSDRFVITGLIRDGKAQAIETGTTYLAFLIKQSQEDI